MRARLLIVSPDSQVILPRRQAETPLIARCRFPEPALCQFESAPLNSASIYSARVIDITRKIEYVGPTFRKVPITRHLSPSEQALNKSYPDAVRSIVQK
jgi:hypothetical protein